MYKYVPLRRMAERVDIAKSEGDTATFTATLYMGELLAKVIVAAMVAGVGEDKERNRYRLLHRLVRADGIGEWAAALDDILTGPPSQHLLPQARNEQRELTQKQAKETWQASSVEELRAAADVLGIKADPLGSTVALRQWFPIFAAIRNKTRGHGAQKSADCGQACDHLDRSIRLVADNFSLFSRPWAFLHKNLSGKYRVTPISSDTTPFDHLRSTDTGAWPDGVYVAYDDLSRVDLIYSDPDLADFRLPNGGFRSGHFELLSYITGDTAQADAAAYADPAQPLPPSHTHPLGTLEVLGSSFTNLPPMQRGYIPREVLEGTLREQLLLEMHPIVTLTGMGGIGKTSLALATLHGLAPSPGNRFDIITWFSARDIDLLEHGPKPVQPQAISLADFAEAFVTITQPAEARTPGFDPVSHLGAALSSVPVGPALYVFDNFETVVSPEDVFRWIDTFIRPPNKVLITTRSREFAGDYPIEVTGMTDHQARALIDSYAKQLGIQKIITKDYVESLIAESGGHPYVIKILLGEVAKTGKIAKPDRIVAAKEELLTALFERTYSKLSSAAQRVFLLLCNWRSVIPELAVEAVVLRPGNEHLDVEKAIAELRQSSLIEELVSPHDRQLFLSVLPGAAAFGKKKLTASPLKAAVEADTVVLRDFGAATKEDIRLGVQPRMERMLGRLQERISNGERSEEQVAPVLEFLARRSPEFWLDIAAFYRERGTPESIDRAKDALRRYLESPPEGADVAVVWQQLAALCASTEDFAGEVHALVALCESPKATIADMSSAANRINNIISALKRRGMSVIDTEERKLLVRRVAQAMARVDASLDAVDCSRLAWLHLHLGDTERALELAQRGLQIDDHNEYCLGIVLRLTRARETGAG